MNPEEPQVDSPQIYCPYTNLQTGTTVALANYTVNFVNCTGDKWAYTKYFQDRWDEGKTFINVEHDIVFWPGAIEELIACEQDWCYFSDQWRNDGMPIYHCRFGLTKIGATLIEDVPDVWNDFLRRYTPIDPPAPYNMLDTFFSDFVRQESDHRPPHEHFPGTVNINPTYYADVIAAAGGS